MQSPEIRRQNNRKDKRKEKRAGRKSRKVYIRLIITYLFVFLIPCVINIVSLEQTASSMRQDISKSVLNNLNHTRDTLQDSFREIDTIVEKLTNNAEIRYVATQMDEADKFVEVSRILNAQNLMKAMQIQTFVEEYYLFLEESRMVLSPEHVFLKQASMSPYFCYDGMDWESWEEKMGQVWSRTFFPEAKTRQNQKTQDMLLYVQSLITASGMKGNFVFPIRSASIKNLLKDTYVASAGWAYLSDAEGNVLLTIASAQGEFSLVPDSVPETGENIQEGKIGGKAVQIIRTDPMENGLTFTAVLPQAYISDQIYEEQERILGMMLAALAVGVVSILALSWSRGRRIDGILQMLLLAENRREWQMQGNEMTYISDSLSRLIHNNRDLEEKVRNKELVNRGLLLENLLYGRENHMETGLEEYGIVLNGKRLSVIGFQIAPRLAGGKLAAGDTAVYKQILQDKMEEFFPEGLYMCDLGMEEGAFIGVLSGTGLEKEKFQEAMRTLAAGFHEEGGVRLRLAVSGTASSRAEISKCYDQVWEILQYGLAADKDILFQEESRQGEEYYYFPLALEERLVNAVRSGKEESLHSQLKELYEINVLERELSPEMMHFLVNDLQCAVFRILHSLDGQMGLEEEVFFEKLRELNQETDILVRFNRINQILKTLCERVAKENQVSSSEQKAAILEYLEAHYSENDMGLTKIADHFGYASTYFSRLFKDLFYENFAPYLENLRIEKVCELLENSQETVEKIAGKTGYNSVYVMRSAFKRVKGVTPNEYRKMKAEKAERAENASERENG